MHLYSTVLIKPQNNLIILLLKFENRRRDIISLNQPWGMSAKTQKLLKSTIFTNVTLVYPVYKYTKIRKKKDFGDL